MTIAELEQICSREIGRRIAPLARSVRGDLERAAQSIAGHRRPHIAIVTGFFIPDAGYAETDGPIAASYLALGLATAGIPVRVVTDANCRRAVATAVEAVRMASIEVVPVNTASPQIVEQMARAWQAAEPPVSHVVFIERVGPGRDGKCRNMRAVDISPYTAPLHLWASSPAWTSIAVGDGGNEVGMGKLSPSTIADCIAHGELIACRIACEHLLVCGVSNWGGIALLKALALLDSRFAAILPETLELHRRILESIVENRCAVDGVTGRFDLSVDGLGWNDYAAVAGQLLRL